MKVDTNIIKQLLDTETQYNISRNTGVAQGNISNISTGKRKIENLSIEVGSYLTVYGNHILGGEKMIKLIEANEDGNKVMGVFANEQDLITHLQNTDYFGWINENEPDKELPDFNEVETLREVEAIFDEYDYSWWRLELE